MSPGEAHLRVFADADELADEAAARVVALARDAVAERGAFHLVLSGGSTPRRLYERLARAPHVDEVPWGGVHFFFGDERCVPPDHEQSNFRMAREALLDTVSPVGAHVHRIAGEMDPEPAAERYEADVRQACGDPPRFDLVLLGMGDDGHTASLFPGTAALEERTRLAVPGCAPVEPARRVTLTFPAFAAARAIWFLVCGESKAERVAHVFDSGADPPPSARVRTECGRLEWMLDRAAAARLPEHLLPDS